MPSIEIKRRVRWSDCDPAGRIYYARMFDYFGEAEIELLRSVGLIYGSSDDRYDYPRVHVECRFRKILALDAGFVVRASIGKLGRTSIRYDFEVFPEGASECAATGSVTVVLLKNGEPAEIPEGLRNRLNP